MVLPILGVAALATLSIIALVTGAVLIAAYWRDVVSKEVEETLGEDELRNDAVDDILNNPDLTPEQKTELLLKLLGLDEDGTDWGKIILPATLIIGLAIIGSSYVSKGR